MRIFYILRMKNLQASLRKGSYISLGKWRGGARFSPRHKLQALAADRNLILEDDPIHGAVLRDMDDMYARLLALAVMYVVHTPDGLDSIRISIHPKIITHVRTGEDA
jgi:hypothetical protein